MYDPFSIINLIESGGYVENIFQKDKKTTFNNYFEYADAIYKNWKHPLVDELISKIRILTSVNP